MFEYDLRLHHSKKHELAAPEQALRELRKYSDTLCSKSRITPEELEESFSVLNAYVRFLPLNTYAEHLPEAALLAEGIPEEKREEFFEDVDFFASALALNCPVWSNDKLFKKQSLVIVFSTSELASIRKVEK